MEKIKDNRYFKDIDLKIFVKKVFFDNCFIFFIKVVLKLFIKSLQVCCYAKRYSTHISRSCSYQRTQQSH